MKKQNLGQFNTKKNLWLKPHIESFINRSNCKNVLDPFAGNGDLIKAVDSFGFENQYGFDIDVELSWDINDSLLDIPYIEDTIVITNPPYLAKNSAKRNGLSSYKYFNDNIYTDLYQIAVKKVLEKYNFAVFIIPETFILSNLFIEYVDSVTIIEDNLFEDTDCPICVACFKKNQLFCNNNKFSIYKNDTYLFDLDELNQLVRKFKSDDILKLKFNDRKGNLGLIAIDGISEDNKIRFCRVADLNYPIDKILHSSRSITIIKVQRGDGKFFSLDKLIHRANKNLNNLRQASHDIILSPFKNNNKLGIRRRRLDYKLAKMILNYSIN